MRRFLILVLLAFLAGGGQALSSPEGGAQPQALATFRAVADTYVSSTARRRNFGRARVLRVGAARPVARAYVRFSVRRVTARVTRATLRVYALAASRRGISVGSTTNRWSERRLTWANQRRGFRRLAASGRVRSRGWVALDVTRAVSRNGTFNFLLTGRGVTRLSSREGGRAAHLIVQTEDPPQTLIAAGDIADCRSPGDEQTAALVDTIPGTVAAIGDLAYEDGTPAEFATCYQPTWGRFKARTRPALGNHEYHTAGAAGYFAYWGAIAGTPGQGWYSYDLGAWHVVVLNSNCSQVACAAGSAQEAWLRADLTARRRKCTVAYLHHPRFSSGLVPGTTQVQPLYRALYDAGAELLLVGHAHNYQRWAPLDPGGALDSRRGIRQIVVGTGGRFLHPVRPQLPNQEVVNDDTWGVLRVTLKANGYDWQFVPVSGRTFTDSGSATCH